LGHDEHALRRQIDATAADKAEVAFANDLAVNADRPAKRTALLGVNECAEHHQVFPFRYRKS
jgi:hypothetical protein